MVQTFLEGTKKPCPVPCGPTSGFPLNLIPLDFQSWGILSTIAFMQEKHSRIHLRLMRSYNIATASNFASIFFQLRYWFQGSSSAQLTVAIALHDGKQVMGILANILIYWILKALGKVQDGKICGKYKNNKKRENF